MIDPIDPTPPQGPQSPQPPADDPYETQLAQWAKGKVAGGADPTVVDSLVQDKLHAYHAAKSTQPPPETLHDKAVGAASSLYQGLTLGAGNKLTALTRTVLPQAMGGTKGFNYGQALDESTRDLTNFEGKHPIANAVLQGAGSTIPIMATGGMGAGAEVAGGSRLAQGAALAKSGARYGAVSGALSANQPKDVLPGSVKGAAFGAAAAPVTGMLGAAVTRGGANVVRRLFPASSTATSVARAVGAGPVTASERAQGMLQGALEKGGVDPSQTANSVPTNSPTTALDLGSGPAQSLARQARNVPGSTARQTLDDFLGARSAGAGQRVEQALTSGTGHTATDVDLPVEEMIARRSEEAKPLYQAAYAYGEIKNPETVNQIQGLLKDPVFANAWKRGERFVRLEQGPVAPSAGAPAGVDPSAWATLTPAMKAQFAEKMGGVNGAVTTGTTPGGPTVQQVDAWKKGLDAVIESSAGSDNALSRSEARLYRQKLNGVLDRVDAEVPAYAKARDNFAGNSALTEAAQAGAEHFSPKVSADYLHRTLPDMTDGEQEMYRANALNAAVAKIRSMAANPDLPDAARGTNVVQRLMGTSDAGKRLRMLFPDENSYQGFIKQMEQEAQYPATNRFLTGQSSTAAQLAEGGTSPGAWKDLTLAPVSKYAALRLVQRGAQAMGIGRPGMPVAVADAVARQSTQTGESLADLLRKMGMDQAQQQIGRQQTRSLIGNTVAANSPFANP